LSTWLSSRVQGTVYCRIQGRQVHRLINRLAERRIKLWSIKFRGENECTFYITMDQYVQLKPHLRATGCKSRVLRRIGVPFLLYRLWRRKGFVLGAAFFFLALFILSSMVWRIEIHGEDRVSEREILQAAKEIGIDRGAFKRSLPPLDDIKRYMVQRVDGAAWIGVDIVGTKVKFEVVEKVLPEPRKLQNPRHLISSKDAVIVHILAEKGQPMVRVHERVKKGQILISGDLSAKVDPSIKDRSGPIVVADGSIQGLVWYKSVIEMPLIQKHKHFTGETMDRAYIAIGDRALKVKGYRDVPFTKYESKWDEKVVKWRDYTLPLRWLDERVMELDFHEEHLTKPQALDLALQRARADVLLEAGSDASIQSEKVLHETAGNGKVKLTILFEVVENIAVEQPIIKGD
jgi:similar to stage IV sporulation protein